MWTDRLKPSPEQVKDLKENLEKHCQKAADALAQADAVLLVTGAGWSADSGLAVYIDVAKVPAYQARDLNYSEICVPDWLADDPELFYGFWGQCFNDYRQTEPHEGYEIVKRWADDKNGSVVADEIRARIRHKVELRRPFEEEIVQRYMPYEVSTGPAGSFFSFTSNVDAHFHDIFPAHEIHECHGNIEAWQCSDQYCAAGVWKAPLDHCFEVNNETMMAPAFKTSPANVESSTKKTPTTAEKVPHIGQTSGNQRRNPLKNMPPGKEPNNWFLAQGGSNWPQCGTCKSYARPAILMFGDFSWKRDIAQSERFSLWEEAVLDLVEARQQQANIEPLNVCIVEVGCGLNVPTCRMESQRMVDDVRTKGGNVSLVRINPDFPLASDQDMKPSLIPIMSRGLAAIKIIDKLYRAS